MDSSKTHERIVLITNMCYNKSLHYGHKIRFVYKILEDGDGPGNLLSAAKEGLKTMEGIGNVIVHMATLYITLINCCLNCILLYRSRHNSFAGGETIRCEKKFLRTPDTPQARLNGERESRQCWIPLVGNRN